MGQEWLIKTGGAHGEGSAAPALKSFAKGKKLSLRFPFLRQDKPGRNGKTVERFMRDDFLARGWFFKPDLLNL